MRRLLMVVVAVAVCSSFAFAITSKVVTPINASVTTSAGSVSMSVALNTGTAFTWSNVVLGTTQWKAADNWLVMNSNLTDATGGIQIYTDNKNGSAPAPYTGTGNPAGLVDGSTTTLTLPMCWRVVDVSTTSLTIVRGTTGFPDRLWSQELGSAYPCFLWMKDLHTSDFVAGQDYVTVKSALLGIQHAEATWAKVPSPDIIYIGADFSTALGSRTYSARVVVEAFSE